MPPEPEHVHCPQCGYDLRGQTVERCPECGFHYDRPALRSLADSNWDNVIDAYHTAIGFLGGNLVIATGGLLQAAVRSASPLAFQAPLFPCIPILVPFSLIVPVMIRNWTMRNPRLGMPEGIGACIWDHLRVFPPWTTLVLLGTAFSVHFVPRVCYLVFLLGLAMAISGVLRHWDMRDVGQDSSLSTYKTDVLRRMSSAVGVLIGTNMILLIVGFTLSL